MALKLSRAERLKHIEWENGELSVKLQSELLGLNRTSLYYCPITPSAEELAIKNRIDEIYTAHPFFGSRKLVTVLGWEGIHINRKAVQRHMREMGIAGIAPGPNLSKRRAKVGVFPYLLRGVTIECPNQVFGIDITYIRIQHGWMYLVAILDWYSRYVVAWELDQTLEIDFVLMAVDRALGVAIPTIINSDQGAHFTSPQYLERWQACDVQISMDGKGRALDNIFTERLWRSTKYEEVYLNDYQSPKHCREGLTRYFNFYNCQRPHQSLANLTPAQVYFGSGSGFFKGMNVQFQPPPSIQIGLHK